MYSNKTIDYNIVLNKMIKFCDYQERCLSEVTKKLLSFNINKNEKDKLIQYLEENDYINEQRFVGSYINGKFKLKKWGKQKITFELKKKGINPNLISRTIQSLIKEDDYKCTLKTLFEKKIELNNYTLKDLSIKKKLIFYAQSKGYTTKDIIECLNSIEKEYKAKTN